MNVVLITSVCNPGNNPFTYSHVRSTFTPEQRYQQLLNTIFSVKKYVPNPYIVLVECTCFDQEKNGILARECDVFINEVDKPGSAEHVFSEYKGKGERYLLLAGLKFLSNVIFSVRPRFLFKIAARYEISEKFDWKKYDNENMNFLELYPGAVNTTFYKIPWVYMHSLIDYMECDPDRVVTLCRGSIEEYIGKFASINIELVEYVKPLGVKGFVAVCGTIYEG